MRKVKKLLALATCAVLTTSLALTGCGNSSSSGSKGDETVNLTWYTIGQEPKDLQLVEDEINKYLKDKINATIDMKFADFGDYDQKLSVVINSGEAYDLAFTCSWAGNYVGNARKGAFLELDDYLETTGKDMKKEIDQRFWDGAKVEGKTYAVPNQKELGVQPMWVFTKELVDKYNIPYQDIHELEDLEPWLKVIKEKEPEVVPLYIDKNLSPPQYFDFFSEPFGVEYEDEGLTVKNIFDTDKFKSTLKTLRKYYEAGYINTDSSIAQYDKSIKRFVTKADGQPYAEGIWAKDVGYELVASPIMDTHITSASTTGSMIAVSKNSKNPEKAVEFLNLLNTDEHLRNLVNYGIEGTHYDKVADKQIKLLPRSVDYGVAYFSTGNLFKTYVLDTEPTTKWDEFEEFNKNSKVSPALGFKFNPEPVSTQIAGISNAYQEFRALIFSGSVDIDEYIEKLNTKLKEQGMDEVMKEMQKQLDEWKKENK
ncbi:ABC transporter substrate-binding protein [Clostridium chauvoei]|uniref:ABC transporter substrate-binding protein n=2 Tax=Clostridium chauvoei TaxID=46867 RepID=A0ABD4RF66_9CLOT|nr:ABC transporter substrate-binding protein [Clostridium chauvoei]ATD54197.1 ABC transporter substrate-binding protein [Clostridium chauvoei]ATD58123.1 ABC transporter substrate-binding protein [Clostridium chauvoei]MBX7279802.1 ABC transporter substrate-binding protein [Clostridium chauvoei]MBX7282280.1 ABC transporter substrate-binding protein [Clostridium chauvoei]MBX7284693.1 ABC transporter substrate-binding protein [Clostridium chauvoei]